MTTDHFVDPTLFVPPSTQDNYKEGARFAAKANGTTVAAEWSKIVETFEANHERDGAAGWNHLAAWAKDVDPEDIVETDPAEVRKARELASAIQDPTGPAALDLEDSAVKEAVEHAHRTNEARQEAFGGSPAGTDPAPAAEPAPTADGPDQREDANPKTRTATPPKKTTR